MSRIPEISFKLTHNSFFYLVLVLRAKMNEFLAEMPDATEQIDNEDRHEQVLFEHNYWLLKSWIIQADRQQKQNFTIKLDIMYAKAFLEYWKPVDLPTYEASIMFRVLAELDKGLANIEHKRKTKQL